MKSLTGFPYFLLLLLLLSFRSSEGIQIEISKDNRLLATSWFALSAEKDACYLQAYQLAGLQLETKVLKRKKGQKPFAIVTDLDETALDNSAWSVKVLREGKDYPDYWSDWEKAANAPAFPGAVEFFQKANRLKVPVFYVSNRLAKNLDATISNLKNLGFPNADSSHILLKTSTSNKIERRGQVLKNHDIVMLLGDNLADFDGVWEEAEMASRSTYVKNFITEWGKKFIIFPNPMYGGWKDAIFNYKRGLKPNQIDSVWNEKLSQFSLKAEF
jgi:5'-nucleotidase (lipoprotein e(P4) family)